MRIVRLLVGDDYHAVQAGPSGSLRIIPEYTRDGWAHIDGWSEHVIDYIRESEVDAA